MLWEMRKICQYGKKTCDTGNIINIPCSQTWRPFCFVVINMYPVVTVNLKSISYLLPTVSLKNYSFVKFINSILTSAVTEITEIKLLWIFFHYELFLAETVVLPIEIDCDLCFPFLWSSLFNFISCSMYGCPSKVGKYDEIYFTYLVLKHSCLTLDFNRQIRLLEISAYIWWTWSK